jgi:hypothetical protein
MPAKSTTRGSKQRSRQKKLTVEPRTKARAPSGTLGAKFADEYLKYFTAPPATPQGFQVLDLSDGSSITTSSHT